MIDSIHNRPSPKLGSPAQPTLASPGRGFRADYDDTVNAQRPALIDSRGFVVEASALDSVGDGLQKVGGALGELAEARFQAINTRKIVEAEMTLEAADEDIAAEIAKHRNNPEKWEAIAAKRTGEMKAILLGKDLSPAAKRAIELRQLKWSTQTQGQTKMAAVQQEFTLTGQTLEVARQKALEVGDYAKAHQVTAEMERYVSPEVLAERQSHNQQQQEQRGRDEALRVSDAALEQRDLPAARQVIEQSPWLQPEEKKARLARIETTHAVNDMKDDVRRQLNEDPVQALSALQDPTKYSRLSSGERAAFTRQANQKRVELARGEFATYADQIDQLDLASAKAGKEAAEPTLADLGLPELKYVTEAQRQALSSRMVIKTGRATLNDPAAYEATLARIYRYDPAKDSEGEERLGIEADLATRFWGRQATELQAKLEQRSKPVPDDQIDLGPSLAKLHDWFLSGGFGPQEGRLQEDGTVSPEHNPLLQGQTQPLHKLGLVRAAVEKEQRRGDFKNEDDAEKRVAELYARQGGVMPVKEEPASGPRFIQMPTNAPPPSIPKKENALPPSGSTPSSSPARMTATGSTSAISDLEDRPDFPEEALANAASIARYIPLPASEQLARLSVINIIGEENQTIVTRGPMRVIDYVQDFSAKTGISTFDTGNVGDPGGRTFKRWIPEEFKRGDGLPKLIGEDATRWIDETAEMIIAPFLDEGLGNPLSHYISQGVAQFDVSLHDLGPANINLKTAVDLNGTETSQGAAEIAKYLLTEKGTARILSRLAQKAVADLTPFVSAMPIEIQTQIVTDYVREGADHFWKKVGDKRNMSGEEVQKWRSDPLSYRLPSGQSPGELRPSEISKWNHQKVQEIERSIPPDTSKKYFGE